MKHGVVIEGAHPDHRYEFWWMGDRVDVADFNSRLLSATQEIGAYVQGMREGMDLKSLINAGRETVAQLDTLEEVSRLPLCEPCRDLIGKL